MFSSKKLRKLARELISLADTIDKDYNPALTDILLSSSNFQNRLDEEIDRSNRYKLSFSLCFVSPDRIPPVENEQSDPEKVLNLLANQIRSINRCSDFIGIHQNQVLALFFPMTSKRKARYVAERICEKISCLWKINCLEVSHGPLITKEELLSLTADENTFDKEKKSPYLTVSIGVASYPEDCIKKSNIIKIAEKRLNEAIDKGGNRVEIEKFRHSFLPSLPPIVENLLAIRALILNLYDSKNIKEDERKILEIIREKFYTIMNSTNYDTYYFCKSFLSSSEYTIFEKLITEWLKKERRKGEDRRKNFFIVYQERRRMDRRQSKN